MERLISESVDSFALLSKAKLASKILPFQCGRPVSAFTRVSTVNPLSVYQNIGFSKPSDTEKATYFRPNREDIVIASFP